MHRRIMLFVALLLTVPLIAQTKHLVSRIDVRGTVPDRIVVSQTALVAGRSYSDKDLEVAMARLRRLPFVFDARYSIEGETLVIDVDSVRRVFGEVGAAGLGTEGQQTASAVVGAGGRMFLGSGGVAEAHVTQIVTEFDDATSANATYSHYGIAGSRLFASADVRQSFRNPEGFEPDPTWTVSLGYPLTVRQTLTASYVDQGFRSSRSFPGPIGVSRQFGDQSALGLRWTWDTSNDPFFAREGMTISAGPTWSDSSFQFDTFFIDPAGNFAPMTFRTESESTTLDAEVNKFWPTGARGTFFSGLGGHWANDEIKTTQIFLPGAQSFDIQNYGASLSAGYAHNLFDWSARSNLRQRLELGATHTRNTLEQPIRDVTVNTTIVNAAYVVRHPFATVRLTLSYLFDDDTVPVPQQPAEPFRP